MTGFIGRSPIFLLFCISAGSVWAGGLFFNTNGIAINGFDPVAYFEQDVAVKGNPEISFEWKGATWRFSSVENRNKFTASPKHYAPQYGGYCAYAMAEGKVAKSDSRAWTVIDGKLYLNHSIYIRKVWRRGAKRHYIRDANREWRSLLTGK